MTNNQRSVLETLRKKHRKYRNPKMTAAEVGHYLGFNDAPVKARRILLQLVDKGLAKRNYDGTYQVA